MPPRRKPRTFAGGPPGGAPPTDVRSECVFFNKGTCRYGEKCKFSHTAGSINAVKPTAETHDEAAGARNEEASNTPNARQSADGRASAPLPTPTSATNPAPQTEKKKKPCFAWQEGRCTHGQACKYRHDEPTSAAPTMSTRFRRLKLQPRDVPGTSPAQAPVQHQQQTHQQAAAQERQKKKEERERLKAERAERERYEAERRLLEEQERERQRVATEARLAKEREEREALERQKLEAIQRKAVAQREREAKSTLQLVVLGSNLVTFGPGLDVKYIIPGFDVCRIAIRKLPRDATMKEISNLFREQGLSDSMFLALSEPKIEGAFKTAEFLMRMQEAKVMAIGLDGLDFRDSQLEFAVAINNSWGSMTSDQPTDKLGITLIWGKPSAAMVASYGSVEEARRKAKELNGRFLSGRKITACMNARPTGRAALYWNEASIRIGNLDPNTSEEEVEAFADAYGVRAIKSNLYNLDYYVERLRVTLTTYGCVEGSFKMVDIDGNRAKVTAVFLNRASLERAGAALGHSIMGPLAGTGGPRLTVIVPAEHRYTIKIPIPQYRAQKEQWDDMAEGARGSKAFVRVREQKNGSCMFVNVEGSDPKLVGPLKVRVEGLVAGERLGSEYWHATYMGKGSALFDRILRDTGVYVQVDRRLHGLRLFGKGEKLVEAKRLVEEDKQRLENMEWDIPLARQDVRFFVATGLQLLKDTLGEENVTLDVSGRDVARLKLRGGDEVLLQARKLVQDAALAAAEVALQSKSETGDDCLCPICYDTPSQPAVTLACGHPYCDPCLRHYLTSAASSNKFPLTCMGDEASCNAPIAIPLIRRFLTPARFHQLVDAVFSSYIQSNPAKFKYCTTPDCTQIYQCDTDQKIHQCPSCFSKICSGCNEEAHEGMTCEERRIQSDPAEQDRLNAEWARANNVKQCPSCKVWTEKTEGCNHMKCKCGVHFCWICLGVFADNNIYRHMEAAHGSWYAAEDPQAGPTPEQRALDAAIRDVQRQDREEALRRQQMFARYDDMRRHQDERLRAIQAQREWQEVRDRQLREEAARRREQEKNESWCAVM